MLVGEVRFIVHNHDGGFLKDLNLTFNAVEASLTVLKD